MVPALTLASLDVVLIPTQLVGDLVDPLVGLGHKFFGIARRETHLNTLSSRCTDSSIQVQIIGDVFTAMYVCTVHYLQQSKDQPGKVANPARGQLWTGNIFIFVSSFAPENLSFRDRFGRLVPRQPAHSPYSG